MCALGLTELPSREEHSTQELLDAIVAQVGRVILGKEVPIRLAITCILARGHLLIEDVPGVGKTTLAHALSATLGLSFHRIQFTSDLLPADILGVSVYERESGKFKFHPGPIFSQVVLADEVNRATPKAQSALLEAMEEQTVTQDGESRAVPQPFFVIATQNPSYQIGTFPLPESQLDRFLMRLELGYPDARAERALLKGKDRRHIVESLTPQISDTQLLSLQQQVSEIHVSEALLDYLQELVRFTRESPELEMGLSPRAGIAILRCTQAWAMLEGRKYAMPEDVQTVLPSVVGHRLRPISDPGGSDSSAVTASVLRQVPIP